MDEADCAREYSEHLLNVEIRKCIAAQGSKLKAQSRMECEECGETISEARRNAVPGCTRCVGCQIESEMEMKTFGEHIPKRSVV